MMIKHKWLLNTLKNSIKPCNINLNNRKCCPPIENIYYQRKNPQYMTSANESEYREMFYVCSKLSQCQCDVNTNTFNELDNII